MAEKRTPFNFVDLFAGAGGISCGLEQAGMKCLLGVDFNKYAMETFAANHKQAASYCGNISDLSNDEVLGLTKNKDIHLVVGGPPCQGFSTVGPGNPLDERNRLFLEFFRIVKCLNPYFVVIENVTGLLAKKNESTLNAIFKKFKTIGYNMDVKVLAAHEYLVPEKRRRTIILGSRINHVITFPMPMKDKAKTVGQVITNLTTKSGKIFNHDLETAKVKTKLDLKRIKRIPEGKGIRYKKDEISYLPPSLRLKVNWDTIPENRFRQAKYKRLDSSLPAPTIMTHRHTYYHPTEHRFLTAREAAALQSFPNNFFFKGPLSAQWKQIGNAVPPLMAKALGKSILKMYHEAQMQQQSFPLKKQPKHIQSTISQLRSKAFLYKEENTSTTQNP